MGDSAKKISSVPPKVYQMAVRKDNKPSGDTVRTRDSMGKWKLKGVSNFLTKLSKILPKKK